MNQSDGILIYAVFSLNTVQRPLCEPKYFMIKLWASSESGTEIDAHVVISREGAVWGEEGSATEIYWNYTEISFPKWFQMVIPSSYADNLDFN